MKKSIFFSPSIAKSTKDESKAYGVVTRLAHGRCEFISHFPPGWYETWDKQLILPPLPSLFLISFQDVPFSHVCFDYQFFKAGMISYYVPFTEGMYSSKSLSCSTEK